MLTQRTIITTTHYAIDGTSSTTTHRTDVHVPDTFGLTFAHPTAGGRFRVLSVTDEQERWYSVTCTPEDQPESAPVELRIPRADISHVLGADIAAALPGLH